MKQGKAAGTQYNFYIMPMDQAKQKTKCNYIFQDKINQGNKQQNILSVLYIIMLSCKYIIIAKHQTREHTPACQPGYYNQ